MRYHQPGHCTMMYLTFVGNVKQLLAESDQQNLRNDDPCKKTQSRKAIQQLTIQKIICWIII